MGKSLKAVNATMVLIVALAGMVGLSPVAEASEVVEGRVECLNSGVLGIWVEARDSTSGWAQHSAVMEAMVLPGAKDYRFELDRGGPYRLHVGCGYFPGHGSADNWPVTARSEWLDGSGHKLSCNNIWPPANWLSNLAAKYGGVWLYRFDLSRGIDHEKCGRPNKVL